MAYISKTKCSHCGEEFEYYCLPYKAEDENDADPNFDARAGGTVIRSQMVLEWVTPDGIPEYTARCPHCKRVSKLPKSEAGIIPHVYYEGYLPQSE